MNFFNLYNHNYVRIAVAVPEVRVADTRFNVIQSISLMEKASKQNVLMIIFPELGLSAYSCEDLFQQQALLDGCLEGLTSLLEASKEIAIIAVVGLPVMVNHMLLNCAAVIYRGRILGIIPKTYLPNYREFYEMRHFAPGDYIDRDKIDLCNQGDIPFGMRILFQTEEQPLLNFFIEICEDLWVPIPPSSFAALAGATVLINLSASNITVGKEEYRKQLVTNQSGRCISAYVYVSAGFGESTTDLAWDGHGMISENGVLLAETKRFSYHPQLALSDIDLDHLTQDRMRQNSFSEAIQRHRETIDKFRVVRFSVNLPVKGQILLERPYERFPYVSSESEKRDQRCNEVYQIQVQGLVKRLKATSIDKVIIGVSGGLDSTHALLVCAQAMDIMGLPRNHILGLTMPGFATSDRTLNQARHLMKSVGSQIYEIDIRPSCMQMLKDINHPFAMGKPVFDITFENVQAGERTSHLFRLANLHGGIVVGTSDLSELALGWCTYGVGDQMAHYDVNASVPKTLIQYLIRWVEETKLLGSDVSDVLNEVLRTEISPELLPGESGGQPIQRSEDIIGPFELQDFNLYYTLRFGYRPPKIAFLAWTAWHDQNRGAWPIIHEAKRHNYEIGDIKRWLFVFLERFFKQSQFKRSCMPNAPKVGSGGSLSPRGDYRAPSDSEATAWLTQIQQIPDK